MPYIKPTPAQAQVRSTSGERPAASGAIFLLALALILLLLLAGCSLPSGGQVLWDREAAEALRLALTRVGCPYVTGAQGPYSFDCSGLVLWAYLQAYPALRLRDDGGGIVYDATADVLWRLNVQRIALRSARPGDLVFLSWDAERVTHVGLFRRWLDGNYTQFELVNASSYLGQVVSEPWPAAGMNRGMWLVGTGRLKTAAGN